MKDLIFPLIKKFKGLFLSMIFVSILAISLVTAFSSSVANLKKGYDEYMNYYDNTTYVLSTNLSLKSDYNDLKNISGIESYSMRLNLIGNIKKADNTINNVKLISYDSSNLQSKKIVREAISKNTLLPNISLTSGFARNNNYRVGDTLKIGMLDTYIDVYINEIIDVPEAGYPAYNNFIWMDIVDFGYLYFDNIEYSTFLYSLTNVIKERKNIDLEYKKMIEESIFDEYIDLIAESKLNSIYLVSNYTNDILIKESSSISKEIEAYSNDNTNVLTYFKTTDMAYKRSLKSSVSQMNLVANVMPIIFFTIAIVIVALFVNQMIKTMRHELGILMAIGINKKDIFLLLISLVSIICLISVIIGIIISIIMTNIITTEFIRVYSLPTISKNIDILISFIIFIIFYILIIFVTFISSLSILKITPKDALTNNKNKIKNNPNWVNIILSRANIIISLVINSILKNIGRFLISIFAIFSCFIIIALALYFNVSQDNIIKNTLDDRLNYDAQIYFTDNIDEATYNELKSQPFIIDIEKAYMTYSNIEYNNKKINVEIIAKEYSAPNLSYIPNEDNTKSLEVFKNGIILSKYNANILNVAIGDKILINGKEIEVVALSDQYSKMDQYISIEELNNLGLDYIETVYVKYTNKELISNYLYENLSDTVIRYSSSMKADIIDSASALYLLVRILIIFSLLIGFVILSIMIENSLIEQKREISLYMVNGFKKIDIFNIQLFNKLIEFIIAIPIAYFVSIIMSKIVFNHASNNNYYYKFINEIYIPIVAIIFILLVILLSIIINIIRIRKWNLADNLKCQD